MSTRTPQHQAVLDQKFAQLASYKAPGWMGLKVSSPPTTGRQLAQTGFANYPAPNAQAVVVLSYQAPAGMVVMLNYLGIIHFGGGQIDGSGNVVWSVQINGCGYKGLENLQSQIGTWGQPQLVEVFLYENDLFQVTVSVPANQPAMPAGERTGTKILGYAIPVNQ